MCLHSCTASIHAGPVVRCVDPWAMLQVALSTVDVLCSFAAFAITADGPICRPTVLPSCSGTEGRAFLELQSVWHPCAVPGRGASIVPNNVSLGNAYVLPKQANSAMFAAITLEITV